ncbi:uracil-DNA glycosylase family protein [Wenzhouxiangella sp. XN79A]|uniref:uracil-DNA glycosylase family protein n=1 Tax=Wenzhouxiangella sp. XN79A TaxID=2724193 RepID=UPI001F117BED|nr:uracil-DNA glycosylase family protein [Wenzhouxiangella sp. XN79A]
MGPRPVFQVHPTARILIASQAPGRIAHESGIPFQDPSGRRLRHWTGLDEKTFYDPRLVAILPMGLCYPGRAVGGDAPPRPECAPLWRTEFLERMSNIALTLVIGRHAQAWHLPGPVRSVAERARDWLDDPGPVIPLPHPSPRNNAWLERNPWFEDHVVPLLRRRVNRVLGRPR